MAAETGDNVAAAAAVDGEVAPPTLSVLNVVAAAPNVPVVAAPVASKWKDAADTPSSLSVSPFPSPSPSRTDESPSPYRYPCPWSDMGGGGYEDECECGGDGELSSKMWRAEADVTRPEDVVGRDG